MSLIIKIGRESDNDIVIADVSVSRYHCTIVKDDNGKIKIYDHDSSNGTFVNGHKVNKSIELKENDIVRIGFAKPLSWENYFNEPPIEELDDDYDELEAISFDDDEEDMEALAESNEVDSTSNGYTDKIIYAFLFAIFIAIAAYFRGKS